MDVEAAVNAEDGASEDSVYLMVTCLSAEVGDERGSGTR
jgi:S-adenosylmethionine synthetase